MPLAISVLFKGSTHDQIHWVPFMLIPRPDKWLESRLNIVMHFLFFRN
jgi:hypothetical protein